MTFFRAKKKDVIEQADQLPEQLEAAKIIIDVEILPSPKQINRIAANEIIERDSFHSMSPNPLEAIRPNDIPLKEINYRETLRLCIKSFLELDQAIKKLLKLAKDKNTILELAKNRKAIIKTGNVKDYIDSKLPDKVLIGLAKKIEDAYTKLTNTVDVIIAQTQRFMSEVLFEDNYRIINQTINAKRPNELPVRIEEEDLLFDSLHACVTSRKEANESFKNGIIYAQINHTGKLEIEAPQAKSFDDIIKSLTTDVQVKAKEAFIEEQKINAPYGFKK